MKSLRSRNGLNYTDSGNATDTTVVLVHGYTCDLTDWDAQVTPLAEKFRVVALDLNGHGSSPVGEPDIETMGNETAAFISELNLQRVVVVGHSMGTRVVAEAARQCPDRVIGMIFVDGSRGADSEETLKEVETTRRGYNYGEYVGDLFSRMFTDKTPEDLKQRIVARAVDKDPKWSMELHISTAAYDARELDPVLGAIEIPMLVVQTTMRADGGKILSLRADDSSPYMDFVRSRFKHPQSSITVIPGIGHFPQFEAPTILTAEIERFVNLVS